MSFENIIGNKKIKSEFIDNIKNNTLSHSYLFVGQEGIGKKLFAKELAKMALCLNNKTENDNSSETRVWSKPEANVYVDIKNNLQLRSAAIDAMNAWNRTGAFTFYQTDDKNRAQIVISTVDDSDTNAAGETATTYNPSTGHLLKADVHLNRYYLQNEWYGYSNNRIVNTAEHELGHAIGLNHTNSVSVMYPKGSIYTIQPQDIQNVRKIYHEK